MACPILKRFFHPPIKKIIKLTKKELFLQPQNTCSSSELWKLPAPLMQQCPVPGEQPTRSHRDLNPKGCCSTLQIVTGLG